MFDLNRCFWKFLFWCFLWALSRLWEFLWCFRFLLWIILLALRISLRTFQVFRSVSTKFTLLTFWCFFAPEGLTILLLWSSAFHCFWLIKIDRRLRLININTINLLLFAFSWIRLFDLPDNLTINIILIKQVWMMWVIFHVLLHLLKLTNSVKLKEFLDHHVSSSNSNNQFSV